MRKRIISFFLVLLITLSFLPSASAEEEGILIDYVNFPDSYFNTYIRNNIDLNQDERLSASEIAAVKTINIVGLDMMRSLAGIEYFTALESLDCSSNQLSSLDLSRNTALKELNCSKNYLQSLTVVKNAALTSLDCSQNELTSLNLTGNTALTSLNCSDNQLTGLNLSANTALTSLNCGKNSLTSLDLTKNTKLTLLDCLFNYKLTSLDVSRNILLEELCCGSCGLTSLDVSHNTALKTLSCSDNQLTTLIVRGCANLEDINCRENKLTSLDISQNIKLKSLDCLGNQLTGLDVSKNTALTRLCCTRNQITSLDVSHNTALKELQCGYNRLTQIDVSMLTALTDLSCQQNSLTRLNVSKNTALRQLYCYTNQLTNLDISSNPDLATLYCYHNKLTTLDLSNCSCLLDAYKKGDKEGEGHYVYRFESDDPYIVYHLSNMYSLLMDPSVTLTGIADITITTQPKDVIGAPGGTATLTVAATGGSLTYQWQYSTDGMTWVNCKSTGYNKAKFSFTITAAMEGSRYRCVITNSQGSVSSRPATISFGLALSLSSSNKGAALSWTTVNNATKYELSRKEGSGSWKVLATVTGTTYTDANVQMGSVYSYRVRAYVNGAWEDYSQEVTTTFNPFSDVSANASYFKALSWAYNNSVVGGTSATKFSPNSNCTREQFAAMLWKLNGKPKASSLENPFTDVPDSSTYRSPIVWCYHHSIVMGTSATTFSPKNTITRWQIMTMLWRMVGKPKPTLTSNPFTDVKTTDAYYKPALWAYENKITSVKTFKPNDKCTRWQLVVFLYKVNQIYGYIK